VLGGGEMHRRPRTLIRPTVADAVGTGGDCFDSRRRCALLRRAATFAGLASGNPEPLQPLHH
jgi:hypothetical protein